MRERKRQGLHDILIKMNNRSNKTSMILKKLAYFKKEMGRKKFTPFLNDISMDISSNYIHLSRSITEFWQLLERRWKFKWDQSLWWAVNPSSRNY